MEDGALRTISDALLKCECPSASTLDWAARLCADLASALTSNSSTNTTNHNNTNSTNMTTVLTNKRVLLLNCTFRLLSRAAVTIAETRNQNQSQNPNPSEATNESDTRPPASANLNVMQSCDAMKLFEQSLLSVLCSTIAGAFIQRAALQSLTELCQNNIQMNSRMKISHAISVLCNSPHASVRANAVTCLCVFSAVEIEHSNQNEAGSPMSCEVLCGVVEAVASFVLDDDHLVRLAALRALLRLLPCPSSLQSVEHFQNFEKFNAQAWSRKFAQVYPLSNRPQLGAVLMRIATQSIGDLDEHIRAESLFLIAVLAHQDPNRFLPEYPTDAQPNDANQKNQKQTNAFEPASTTTQLTPIRCADHCFSLLCKTLADPSPKVRENACTMLRHSVSLISAPYLLNALVSNDSNSPLFRSDKIHHPTADVWNAAVYFALEDESPNVRLLASELMGEIGKVSSTHIKLIVVEALVEMIGDEDYRVRLCALESLGCLKCQLQLTNLQAQVVTRCLQEPDRKIRYQTRGVIESCTLSFPEGLKHVLRQLANFANTYPEDLDSNLKCAAHLARNNSFLAELVDPLWEPTTETPPHEQSTTPAYCVTLTFALNALGSNPGMWCVLTRRFSPREATFFWEQRRNLMPEVAVGFKSMLPALFHQEDCEEVAGSSAVIAYVDQWRRHALVAFWKSPCIVHSALRSITRVATQSDSLELLELSLQCLHLISQWLADKDSSLLLALKGYAIKQETFLYIQQLEALCERMEAEFCAPNNENLYLVAFYRLALEMVKFRHGLGQVTQHNLHTILQAVEPLPGGELKRQVFVFGTACLSAMSGGPDPLHEDTFVPILPDTSCFVKRIRAVVRVCDSSARLPVEFPSASVLWVTASGSTNFVPPGHLYLSVHQDDTATQSYAVKLEQTNFGAIEFSNHLSIRSPQPMSTSPQLLEISISLVRKRQILVSNAPQYIPVCQPQKIYARPRK